MNKAPKVRELCHIFGSPQGTGQGELLVMPLYFGISSLGIYGTTINMYGYGIFMEFIWIPIPSLLILNHRHHFWV